MPHARNPLKCLMLSELLFHLQPMSTCLWPGWQVFVSMSSAVPPCFPEVTRDFPKRKALCWSVGCSPLCKYDFHVQNAATLEVAVTLLCSMAVMWVKITGSSGTPKTLVTRSEEGIIVLHSPGVCCISTVTTAVGAR